MTFMGFIVGIKQILDAVGTTITTLTAAGILITELFKRVPGIKRQFTSFFCGTSTSDGKRVRFFKGLKIQKERTKNIMKAIAPELDMEEILVLDKKALLDSISESNVFYKMTIRKNR
jgi:hypothetical protein